MTEHNEAPATEATSTPSDEPTLPASGPKTVAVTARPSGGLTRLAGLVLAVAGVGLTVAPPSSVQAWPPVSDLQGQSGALVIAGLVLFTLGAARRGLSGIRSALDQKALSAEQVAEEGRALHAQLERELETLRADNEALHEHMNVLEKQNEQIVEIASDPSFQTSVFRMAASLDQLGERIDVAAKERHECLQESVLAASEQVRALDADLKRQHESVLAAQRGSDEKIVGSATELGRCIEAELQGVEQRVGERMHQQHQALAAELGRVSEQEQQSARGTSAGLEELREHVSQQVEGQTVSLHERLDGLEGRFNRIDRDHAASMNQLTERLQRELAGRSQELAATLEAMAALDGQRDGKIAQGFDELGSVLEERACEQLAELRSALQQTLENAGETSTRITADVEQLGARIEQVLEMRCDALTNDLTSVVELVGETVADLQQQSSEPTTSPEEPVESAAEEPWLEPSSETPFVDEHQHQEPWVEPGPEASSADEHRHWQSSPNGPLPFGAWPDDPASSESWSAVPEQHSASEFHEAEPPSALPDDPARHEPRVDPTHSDETGFGSLGNEAPGW